MNIYIAILTMASVTYLIRALPLTLITGKIKSRFVKSFLYYIPYTVLAAMTFPAILSSTGNTLSAVAGLAVALILSYLEKGLLTVSLSACAAAFIVSFIV